MNIGIDLDGVVYNSEAMLKCMAEFYDQQLGGKGVINKEELLCQNRYDWTIEQENNFLKLYLLDILKAAPLKPMAKETIDMLKKDGHNLYIITSRGNVFKEEIKITQKRLKKDKISVTKEIYSASNKAKLCKELNIDVMIDDYYNNVSSIANEGIKCLYFRDFVLKFADHKNITEVNNWGEVYRQINLMKK